jgi:hypothetical protein
MDQSSLLPYTSQTSMSFIAAEIVVSSFCWPVLTCLRTEDLV